jgi:hypothetical protein
MVRTRLLLSMIFLACGCATRPVTATSSAPDASPTSPLAPTSEAVGTSTPDAGPPPSHAMANNVAFDFGTHLCSATWSNNGVHLPCPGEDAASSPNGFVGLRDPNELGLKLAIPVILTYPAQNTFEGIFGRFPAYQVQRGDQFYTHMDCLPDAACDVEFGIEYYDQDGTYHSGFAAQRMQGSDPMEEFIVDLSPLADQLIELVLVVRPLSDRASAYAVWIGPVILSYPAG